MLGHVAVVRAEVSEDRSASIIKVTRIGGLGTTLAVTSNRRTLRRKYFLQDPHGVTSQKTTFFMDATCFPETSVLTRSTLRHIPEDGILHSSSSWRRDHRRVLVDILVILRSPWNAFGGGGYWRLMDLWLPKMDSAAWNCLRPGKLERADTKWSDWISCTYRWFRFAERKYACRKKCDGQCGNWFTVLCRN
jgi:hypothetical protein